MVHVEYTAEGTEYEHTHERDFADGSDRKIESVHVRRDVEVEAYIELPGGHVNLEAYAPSHDPEGVAERLQHNYTPDGIEIDGRTIEAAIHGNSDEWITQARRYISERPSMDVFDALETFRKWDSTDSGSIDAAMERAADDDVAITPLSGAEA